MTVILAMVWNVCVTPLVHYYSDFMFIILSNFWGILEGCYISGIRAWLVVSSRNYSVSLYGIGVV